MGRVKLMIKRLESSSNRKVTYSKRRSGILKKAKELSILCDIDIVLLMFSPAGRPTAFHGDHSCWANIDRIENIEPVEHLEESLRKSIGRVHIHKEHFRKNQLMSLECTTTQFQSAVSSPLVINDIPRKSWLPDNKNQQMIISSLLTQVFFLIEKWKIVKLHHFRFTQASSSLGIKKIRIAT